MLRPRSAAVGSAALVVAGAAVCLLTQSAVVRGAAIGVVLGLVNLWVGLTFLQRVLQSRTGDMMQLIAFGFVARLAVLLGMLGVVGMTTAISATAFGFSFLALVVIYFGIEISMAVRWQDRIAA